MAEKKMTKKDYYNMLLAMDVVSNDADLVKFINRELEILAKKNVPHKKPLVDKNAGFQQEVVAYVVEANVPLTTMDIAKAFDTSPQKAGPAANKMVEAGLLQKVMYKRRAYFAGPEVDMREAFDEMEALTSFKEA